MKRKPKFAFRVKAFSKKGTALVICVISVLDEAGKYYSGHFFELSSSFDNSGLTFPPGTTANFQLELRLFHEVIDLLAVTDQITTVEWVKAKMFEAYGGDISTDIIDMLKSM